mmetsp:Transcript_40791/g.101352  ORF Transcript_40791/g.101352 Transcript_40791/m.101352 type:complete len:234 (+) Transcript_40791:1717-2418(+)
MCAQEMCRNTGARNTATLQCQATDSFFVNGAQMGCNDYVATDADMPPSPPAVAQGSAAFCLPSWRWKPDLLQPKDHGSASDGDEDALLGLILLTLGATEEEWPCDPTDFSIPCYRSLVLWAYQSCRSFLQYNTAAHSTCSETRCAAARADPNSAQPLRILKVGSCGWTLPSGWDCISPSYLAPAHYRVFRDFMIRWQSTSCHIDYWKSTSPRDSEQSTCHRRQLTSCPHNSCA